jgi:hypothetical protein
MRTASKVVTAVGASGVLLALASPSASPDVTEDRFTVKVQVVDYHVQDVGRNGPSMGDTSTHVARVYHQGEQVGREVSHCQVFRAPNKSRFGHQCVLTWTLRGKGQITMQGVSSGAHPETRAITGGTGEYREAAGTVKAIPGRAVRFQVRLTD